MKHTRRFDFPARYALLGACVYGGLSTLWIYTSTRLVEMMASSIVEMGRLETLKGYFFCVVTSLLFFLFSYSVYKAMSNSAQNLVQSQRRLVQAERDAITGLIATSVAHDFTNLLTILRLNTERLKTLDGMPPASVDPVARLDRSVDRLKELADRMRQAGQHVLKNRPHSFNVTSTIQETLDLLRGHELLKNCDIQFASAANVPCVGYPILIHQLLMNLILNAAEATKAHGHIVISVARVGNAVSLEVSDDGPGVAPELRERVFDAFFTTKPHGTGLGLMSVKSCVDIHGGSVAVMSPEAGGATFRVLLPDLDETRPVRLKLPESLNNSRMIPEPLPML